MNILLFINGWIVGSLTCGSKVSSESEDSEVVAGMRNIRTALILLGVLKD